MILENKYNHECLKGMGNQSFVLAHSINEVNFAKGVGNTLVYSVLLGKQQMQQQCWDYSLLYQFWLAEICICHKPRPIRDETCNLQITLPRTLMLPFFIYFWHSTCKIHWRLVLNFEVGHFAHHFLLLSFFFLVLLSKEFIPHSFVVTFYFSHSFGSPPVFIQPGTVAKFM